jgi:pimeloyl-ACP methyl ester carboxylesterase
MTGRSSVRRLIGFVLRLFVAAVVVTAVIGAICEQVGQRRDRERLPQVGRSVDIGGRSLNIFCSGDGRPAVIFDSGNPDPGYIWADIQPEVAKFTRACWFDRAGLGWSDPGAFPRTSAAMSTELHELLHRAGIPAPYVLVGHSLGGMNIRVYNGLYPEDVAGAVLVEAAHEDEPRRAPPAALGHTAPRYLWRAIWIAGEVARFTGLLRAASPSSTLPADATRRTRRDVVRELRRKPNALASEFDASAPESYAEAERSGGFGDRPLIVLTGGTLPMPENPTEDDRALFAYHRVWMREIQPKLARLSTRGRQVIVERAGHRIPDEAPDAVIAAVRELLAEVRTPPLPASGGNSTPGVRHSEGTPNSSARRAR